MSSDRVDVGSPAGRGGTDTQPRKPLTKHPSNPHTPPVPAHAAGTPTHGIPHTLKDKT